ncbi:unnamed protein product [Rhizophagus irregularis]|nr:unnamed protein product [Rhizophagus irregularis]
MELNQECYNSQDPNDPFFSDKIIINEETEILMEESEEYKRSKTQVLVKLYHEDQVNEILNELKIYLDCYAQDYALLIQFYGISQHPDHKAYLLIKKYAQNDSLHNYILHNFKSLDWEIKLHLLLYLAEGLKALHNSGYVHRNLNPPNVLVFENGLCAIGSYSKCR